MRGWLLLLGAFLFAWEPMRVAAEWQATSGSLAMRGSPAVVELIVHAVVAALAVAAALALWNTNPAAPALATLALAASAAVSVQSLFWSWLPHQTAPAERLPFAVLAIVHAAAWILYLRRSPRVRATFS